MFLTINFVLFVLPFKVFAARANFPMTVQTISLQREFTAETRSTPRKEFYQVKLLTLRPLCLCGESCFSPSVAALPRWSFVVKFAFPFLVVANDQ